jgi:glycosyltransferase involved in cell wall biosynthesis
VRHRLGRRVRLYQTLRTAHLEQALDLAPASILYQGRRYDFDEALADQLDLTRAGVARSAWLLFTSPVEELEINEPLMRYAVRATAVAALAARAGALLHRRPLRVVTYCIELYDYFRPGHGTGGAWRRATDGALSRLTWRLVDRAVWGSTASQRLYREKLPVVPAMSTSLIPALPQPCTCAGPPRDAGRVLFLGAFSERKGFDLLLDAWPLVRAGSEHATLVLVGKGSLEHRARDAARVDRLTELHVDPPRDEIHRQLRRAQVLVLPSQPGHGWREQIGRPLLEGLAHGCTVVTTDESGLAGWLAEHGHHVLPAPTSPVGLSRELLSALSRPRAPADVIADLPVRDGRLAADDWMFSRD